MAIERLLMTLGGSAPPLPSTSPVWMGCSLPSVKTVTIAPTGRPGTILITARPGHSD